MNERSLRTACASLLLLGIALLVPHPVLAAEVPSSPGSLPDTIALVNGAPVTRDLLEVFAQAATRMPLSELTEAQRNALLDALIRAEIIAQQAEKLGLQPASDAGIPNATAAQAQFARLSAMNQAAFENYTRQHEPTDDELQAEYQQQIADVPLKQYHAHHILLKSQAEADAVIKALKAGGRFEDIATKQSIDGSSASGGDLGWVSLKTMPEAFAATLKSMKPGEVSARPVETTYGWHVIRLDGTRAVAPPSFESMRDTLATASRTQHLQAYVGGLLKGADVQKFQ